MPNTLKKRRTIAIRIAKSKKLFLEQLEKTPIVQLACEKSGIARPTMYRWRERDKVFAIAVEKALHEGRLLVNDVAESQLMAAIRERNMTAILYWLKHHHPSYTTKVEITAQINQTNELTPEQKEFHLKAIDCAKLPKLGELVVLEPDYGTHS